MMNSSHGPLTDGALTHLEIPEGATVLDVGCGGGRTISKLVAKAEQVTGLIGPLGASPLRVRTTRG